MTLPFKLIICGLDELPAHAGAPVTHVLSILDPTHPAPEAFGSFGEHDKLELRFDDVIDDQPGKKSPQPSDVEALLSFGHGFDPSRGAQFLVHCHAGVSRSTASAALLIAQAQPNLPAARIFDQLATLRPQLWPNLRLIELGDARLHRQGELIDAVARLYARQLARTPALRKYFRGLGRERELNAAQPFMA
ncbi:tyrosine phosphatase family protein [Acidocella sp.]|uniref:tyrosine phosphatase family protein n=1 Tax=Acidocella sp. TaxID=50710 RepID=UPI00261FBEFD|nr:protein-tyrosine-phosphatase [Acidocella sp.]